MTDCKILEVTRGENWAIQDGDCSQVLKELPDSCVQCVVTSPPYFGLRKYLGEDDPSIAQEIGSASEPDCLGWATKQPCGLCYVCRLVLVFREVRRVLHKSGTLWLNLADSYNAAGRKGHGKIRSQKQKTNRASAKEADAVRPTASALKQKDLIGIPWRVALALQADGWHLRADITWAKENPMPESVRDRPTKSTEHIFLFSKSKHYFYDRHSELVPMIKGAAGSTFTNGKTGAVMGDRVSQRPRQDAAGRNLWNWWEVPLDVPSDQFWKLTSSPSKLIHLAVFPPEIPRRIIRLASPEHGSCSRCLQPWVRTTEVVGTVQTRNGKTNRLSVEYGGIHRERTHQNVVNTTGWKQACRCDGAEPIQAIILDPFSGVATTGLVARQLDRRFMGIELNPEFSAVGRKRIVDDNQLARFVEKHVEPTSKPTIAQANLFDLSQVDDTES